MVFPPVSEQLQGLIYRGGFISGDEESELLAFVRSLRFRNFEMRGFAAKRRVIHFGFHYSFERFNVTPADPIPQELNEIRLRAADLAGIPAEEFAEALVTEYQPGAGIGWHRDAPPFGIVAGISLGGECRMRFQRGKGAERKTAAIVLEPRSIYLLTGESRAQWEHTISPMKIERYSITFRTLRRSATLRVIE
jgi:DNA oxidative demethylase